MRKQAFLVCIRGDEGQWRKNLQSMIFNKSIRQRYLLDAFYYAKKNEQVRNRSKSNREKTRPVIEEQAKHLVHFRKDVIRHLNKKLCGMVTKMKKSIKYSRNFLLQLIIFYFGRECLC
ncbi:hypothetical protein CW304_29665 [Bacillus sp. UFRGS-B20]|nr:hypothetical protein CW304_29665 [Bacillus sp. UFRGS-B20]